MVVNPQLECLPEHQGPALNTWKLIMQSATEKSMQPSPPSEAQQNTEVNTDKKLSMSSADIMIPLKTTQESNSVNEDSASDTTTSIEEKQTNRKKSVASDGGFASEGNEEVECKVGVSPWKTYAKYPEGTYGLHLEIIDFYSHISPLPEEEVMRQDVVHRMCELITRIFPGTRVEVFGSFETHLYLPSSDIDLAVFGDWDKLPLFALKEALITSEFADPSSIKVLDKASVPIIKLRDKRSKVRVDISFNTDASVKSVAMIKSYIKKFPRLPYLFLTLKHFLVQRDLNEVFTGGISSYCLLLLTVSFFQRPRPQKATEQPNLGILLMEFLELYGRNLNYQRIGIKIKDGGCYISKDKLTTDLGNGEYPALLCIEDPVTLACDIGKSSYGILRVKDTFEYAFNIIDVALRTKWYFKVNPNSTYLSRIISITQELFNYRKWVQKTYRPMLNISRTLVPHTLYQSNIANHQSNDGKPPLLPTPALYSPRIHVPTPSPFSPYTTNSNGITFNQFAFIGNNKLVAPQQPLSQQQLSQQHMLLSSIPTCLQSNKENMLSNIQINQQNTNTRSCLPHNTMSCLPHQNTSTMSQQNTNMSCLPPVGYAVPRLINASQLEQTGHKQPTYSIIKKNSINGNSKTDKSLSNHSNSSNHSNLSNHSNSSNHNNHSNHSNLNHSIKQRDVNRSYEDIGVSLRTYSPKSTPRRNTKHLTSAYSAPTIYNGVMKDVGNHYIVYKSNKNSSDSCSDENSCEGIAISQLKLDVKPDDVELLDEKETIQVGLETSIEHRQLIEEESVKDYERKSLHSSDGMDMTSVLSDSSSIEE